MKENFCEKMERKQENRKKLLYTQEAMALAVEEVKSERMKANAAAKLFEVPISTLEDRVAGRHSGKIRAQRILTKEEELLLVEWMELWARMGQPLTKAQILKIASKIAAKHGHDEKFFGLKGIF